MLKYLSTTNSSYAYHCYSEIAITVVYIYEGGWYASKLAIGMKKPINWEIIDSGHFPTDTIFAYCNPCFFNLLLISRDSCIVKIWCLLYEKPVNFLHTHVIFYYFKFIKRKLLLWTYFCIVRNLWHDIFSPDWNCRFFLL